MLDTNGLRRLAFEDVECGQIEIRLPGSSRIVVNNGPPVTPCCEVTRSADYGLFFSALASGICWDGSLKAPLWAKVWYPYMPRYRVTCTVKNLAYDRILSLGCVLNGVSLTFTEGEVIKRLRAGDTFYVEQPSGHVAKLEVVEHANPPYVKTKPDGEKPNNLISLPHCKAKPVAVVAPIIPPAKNHGN